MARERHEPGKPNVNRPARPFSIRNRSRPDRVDRDANANLSSRRTRLPFGAAISFARRLRPLCLIDRYLLKELIACFAFGLGTFTFVLMMGRILRLMELIIDKGLGVGVVIRLFLYVLPFSLMVTIPMSVLFAVLATYGRLSSEG
ncbi:MAG: LptF/LptG family permease, partial [Candidatus Methylomirabilaceae bacterium]